MGKNISGGNQSRGPNQSNWGRGQWRCNPSRVGDVVVVVEVDPGTEGEVQAEGGDVVPVGLIPWLATGVGCVAIWPMTVPALAVRRRVVAALAPLEEVRPDPGNQAQEEEEEEDGMFTSAA